MMHTNDADVPKGVRIASVALGAIVGIDADRARLYFDLVVGSLSESNLLALQNMSSFKDRYLSHFAMLYVAEGCARGRVELLTRQLAARFGPLSAEVEAKIESSSIQELDAIGDRLLAAMSLEAALRPRKT